jgi:hypothetical protein
MNGKHIHKVSASGISSYFKGLENECAPIMAITPRTHAIIRDESLTVPRTEEWSWV